MIRRLPWGELAIVSFILLYVASFVVRAACPEALSDVEARFFRWLGVDPAWQYVVTVPAFCWLIYLPLRDSRKAAMAAGVPLVSKTTAISVCALIFGVLGAILWAVSQS